MHLAENTRLYLAKGFKVVAVEAMPDLAQRAAEELRDHVDSGQLVIENVAIAEVAGQVPFYVNQASEWGTIRADWAQRNERLGSPSTGRLTVGALPFGDLLERYGVPYYLKIDIEGAGPAVPGGAGSGRSAEVRVTRVGEGLLGGARTSSTCSSASDTASSRWSRSTRCPDSSRQVPRGKATTSHGRSASAPAGCSGRDFPAAGSAAARR